MKMMSNSEVLKWTYFRPQMYPTFQAFKVEFRQQLASQYSEREIKQLFAEVVYWIFEWTNVDLAMNLNQVVDSVGYLKMKELLEKLQSGMPLQQITGRAWFMDRWFHVNGNVLIPRPETEELVRWVLELNNNASLQVLDIGTGTGIIPISLQCNRSNWQLYAMDVSTNALHIAQQNGALHLKPDNIHWVEDDILKPTFQHKTKFDIIISNPPYVLKSELCSMSKSVVDFEPHIALFVNENDPLLFYRKIIEFSKLHLKSDGQLFFEIHENLGTEMTMLMKNAGYNFVELRTDFQNKNRMIRGVKRQSKFKP